MYCKNYTRTNLKLTVLRDTNGFTIVSLLIYSNERFRSQLCFWRMSFSFFRGEDIFPRSQFRVPPYLRNYAKTAFRHPEDELNTDEQLNSRLDGTIQGHSLGKTDNLPSICRLINTKASTELGNTRTKQLPAAPEKPEKSSPGVERTDMNRNQLNDLHRSIQTRLAGPGLESIDLYPLAGMRCTGQRMSLAESQQNSPKRGSIPEEISAKESLPCEQVVSNGTTTGAGSSSSAVSLNKLYSCLKKMKGRRNDVGQYEDLATISMTGREPGFSKSYFQRMFATNNARASQTRGEQEEIFLLLGGKSKPVRFQINPEGLHLLEKEWRVELKSRDSIFCNSDEEGLELLQKFRARFRLGNQRSFLDRKTPSLPIPWARHVVHKGRRESPEEKEQLEDQDCGRKLSIHVYLPNAGWEEQRNPTPATPMFSPSR